MKLSNVSKVVSAGVIAASLSMVPFTLPAQAQVAPGTEIEREPTGVIEVERENDFDWGWLGLLGLLGLAGLAGKKRQEHTTTYSTSDPDVGVRPGTDYRR
jgi:hypothetical protein